MIWSITRLPIPTRKMAASTRSQADSPDPALPVRGWRPVVGEGPAGPLGRSVSSTALAHAQVPLAQQPHLLAGVALVDHPVHEVFVLLRLVGARLGIEADDRQQFLGVGEHLLLDHRAQLLIARPYRVLALV